MSQTLPVHVGRSERAALECPESFSASGPFAVSVHNHDRDVHVHCSLVGPLAEVAVVEEANVHVPQDEAVRVRVGLRGGAIEGPVSGALKLVVAYGAEEAEIPVTLEPASADEPDATTPVRTGEPSSRSSAPQSLPDDGVVLAVAGLALVVAVAAAVTVGEPVVWVGAGIVVLGVGGALALLLRD